MSEIVDNSFSDLFRQKRASQISRRQKKSIGIIREWAKDEFPDNEYSPSSKHGAFYSVFLLSKTHSISF